MHEMETTPTELAKGQASVYINNDCKKNKGDDQEERKKSENKEWKSGNGNLKEMQVDRDLGLPNDKRNRETIKQQALSINKDVTLVGLKHVMDPNISKARRVIWSLWILFGVGLAVYQIQNRISQYLRYPFDTKFTIKQTSALQFPQVTICRQHNINKSKAEELGVLWWLQNAEIGGNNGKNRERNISNDLTATNWDTMLKNISYPWIYAATWAKDDVEGEEVKTDLGYCIAFGSENQRLTSKEGGLAAGLKILLDDFESSFLSPYVIDQDLLSGYRVLIHDPSEKPLLRETGFVVRFGTASQIQISLENITQLPSPYGDCNNDPTYKHSSCTLKLWKDMALRSFNCTPLHMNDGGDHNVCGYATDLQMRRLNDEGSFSDEDRNACGQECLRKLYKFSSTQTSFSRAFFEKDRTNWTTKENMTMIYIYYPLLMYENIESVPSYGFFALLSEIGGALALLLGATLLTLYELGEFVFQILKEFIRYRFA